jgi:hypothetical protein
LDTTGNSLSREGIVEQTRRGVAEEAWKFTKSEPGRAKIAEGEYAVVEEANFGAAEPFGDELYHALTRPIFRGPDAAPKHSGRAFRTRIPAALDNAAGFNYQEGVKFTAQDIHLASCC